MCAKDSNGSRLFTSDEFLTASQIAGFFSHLALRKTLVDEEQQADIEVTAHDAGLKQLVNEAVHELAPKHPIVFDSYNLCELASQKKLSALSIAVLKDICSSFGIDLSDVTVRRRKPYIDKLQSLSQECACQR